MEMETSYLHSMRAKLSQMAAIYVGIYVRLQNSS